MAFPCPAANFAEKGVSPNGACNWKDSPSQFLVQANNGSWRAGIKKDAVLVVNKARKAVDGSLVIVQLDGEFEVRRLRAVNGLRLESLDHPGEVRTIESCDIEGNETILWGVVTHIINDACTDEFDDCPII